MLAGPVVSAGPAAADMISTEGIAPYEICALCHGLDGNAPMAKFPKLAGQPAAYIEKQVHDFRDGLRANSGGQMPSIVSELTPEEIPVAAAWFAAQPAPPPGEPAEDASALFADLGCVSCHLENAQIDGPRLTAQHAGYLAKQMRDYRDGARANDPDAVMRQAMAEIGDAEIDAIAAWLASLPRPE